MITVHGRWRVLSSRPTAAAHAPETNAWQMLQRNGLDGILTLLETMANEPQYRDLAKLVPYIFPFNDAVVVRIDRVSMSSAAIVGLFAILYFSLAPAASSTVMEVSSVLL